MQWFEIFIPITIFGACVLAIKIIADYKLRKTLIEKSEINENIKFLFKGYTTDERNRSNLKWGMILIGIGLPFLLRELFPRTFYDESILGFIFIFAGIGFLLYYFLGSKQNSNNGNDS